MKRIIYTFIVIAVMIILMSGTQKSAGPPGCNAGEPPLFKTCVSCHDDKALNSGNAQVLFDLGGAENGYTPGETYTITVSIKKTGMKAAGFQAIALQDNNISRSPGTFILTEPNRTQKVDKNNPHAHGCGINDKVWIEHKFQGILSDTSGESKWTYQWKAPDTSVGNVTFYLAALEANHDLTDNGDYTYTRTITAPPMVSSSIATQQSHPLQLRYYPAPANSVLFVEAGSAKLNSVALFNVNGTIIKQFDNLDGNQKIHSLKVDDVPTGFYVAVAEINGQKVARRVLIQ